MGAMALSAQTKQSGQGSPSHKTHGPGPNNLHRQSAPRSAKKKVFGHRTDEH